MGLVTEPPAIRRIVAHVESGAEWIRALGRGQQQRGRGDGRAARGERGSVCEGGAGVAATAEASVRRGGVRPARRRPPPRAGREGGAGGTGGAERVPGSDFCWCGRPERRRLSSRPAEFSFLFLLVWPRVGNIEGSAADFPTAAIAPTRSVMSPGGHR